VTTTDARDVGLLALRVGIGTTLFAHGTQKLFGWFGGHGLDGTSKFFESVGFTPGRPIRRWADGGYEYPAMLGLTAAALALGGPGQLSLVLQSRLW